MVARFRWLLVFIVSICSVLSASTAVDTDAAKLAGKPKFSEGKALGYFVWRDGDTWKVRWTTFGAAHRFNGRVVVAGGEIASLKRIDVDAERKVIAPGRRPHVVRGPGGRVRGVAGGRPAVVASREEDHIEQDDERTVRFNTRTDDDIDGFDFKVKGDPQEIRFFLMIDGEARPREVEVGRDNFKPNADPLIVRLR
jgi:hypothetical protein